LYRKAGDPGGEGRALGQIGIALLEQGEVERAIEMMKAALPLHWESKDAPYVGLTTSMLGLATFVQGNQRDGIALAERGLAEELACGEQWGANMVRPILAFLYFAHGEVGKAVRVCLDQLAESVEEDLVTKNAACIGLTCVAHHEQRYAQAARFAGIADALTRRTGVALYYGFHALFPSIKEEVRSALGDPAYAEEWAVGHTMTFAQLMAEATALLQSIGQACE
jgi:hypothetical protein